MIEDNWNYTNFKLSFIKLHCLTLIIKKYLIAVFVALIISTIFYLVKSFLKLLKQFV